MIGDIFKKWLGKRIDFDGGYGFQCVDWARQFAKEIKRDIATFGGSAYNGWATGKPFGNNWERVPYKTGTHPQAGCIVFLWKTASNPYGHVAVSGDSNETWLTLVEQNAGSGKGDGTGGNAITQRSIPYVGARGNCLGWYRPLENQELAIKAGIWNGTRGEAKPTRWETAIMIIRASGKKSAEIWNGQDADKEATQEEINTMLVRAFKAGAIISNRRDLAGFCFEHK